MTVVLKHLSTSQRVPSTLRIDSRMPRLKQKNNYLSRKHEAQYDLKILWQSSLFLKKKKLFIRKLHLTQKKKLWKTSENTRYWICILRYFTWFLNTLNFLKNKSGEKLGPMPSIRKLDISGGNLNKIHGELSK